MLYLKHHLTFLSFARADNAVRSGLHLTIPVSTAKPVKLPLFLCVCVQNLLCGVQTDGSSFSNNIATKKQTAEGQLELLRSNSSN